MHIPTAKVKVTSQAEIENKGATPTKNAFDEDVSAPRLEAEIPGSHGSVSAKGPTGIRAVEMHSSGGLLLCKLPIINRSSNGESTDSLIAFDTTTHKPYLQIGSTTYDFDLTPRA